MIRPEDCLSVQDKQALKDLEVKIDNYLINTYDGSRKLNLSHIIMLSEGKMRTEICKRYRNAGWDVSFKPCNQGGQAADGPYFFEQTEPIERGVQLGDR